MTAHLIGLFASDRVYGCDVVEDLVSWCKESMPEGRFKMISPFPPTAYKASFFDIIIGTSVFTHLDRTLQYSWLSEIDRILAPGGLVLVSTLGEYALLRDYFSAGVMRNLFPQLYAQRRMSRLQKERILDDRLNPTLDRVTSKDYYRDFFQTRDYVAETWAQHFEILEYWNLGLGGFQDLVVTSKRV